MYFYYKFSLCITQYYTLVLRLIYWSEMSTEQQPAIPDVCQECPMIVPYRLGAMALQRQIELMERIYPKLSEYASTEIIDSRITDLHERLETQRTALTKLAFGTIGCSGVAASSAQGSSNSVAGYKCPSVLMR